MSWATYEDRNGDTLIISIVPVDDIIPHTIGSVDCICDPLVDHATTDGIIVTHNSFDGREEDE